MSKIKTAFICQNCGASSVKWQGKCTSCGGWNTFIEEIVPEKKEVQHAARAYNSSQYTTLADFEATEFTRIELPDEEINRVVGNGLVPGSLTLLGGEPGIGKSTLLLQLVQKITNRKTLYISGEESLGQIKLRAKRVGVKNADCYLLSETNLDNIIHVVDQLKPELIIIDSIQTLNDPSLDSTSGSVTQIRECAAKMNLVAKNNTIPVFLIGHITKEGYIAGPKILEHMVDTVLYFEGDRNHDYRILRTIKNRFGSVSDIGIYEMNEKGLQEIKNPSEVLLSQRDTDISGIAISATIEGLRPMLIEIQALVSPTHYGVSQRTTTGFDSRRLSMLLAVLEKRCGLKMSANDVFLNIAGGIRVEDPSIDLGAVVALSSSCYDAPIKNTICFAGEVGLSGEIRPARQIDKRITEAEKLGFEQIYVSKYNKNVFHTNKNIQVIAIDTVQKLIKTIF
jgi:DNA repair protein RadA/Sms